MQKLYCYVDETGQDTEGDLFIVAVVMTDQERQRLAAICEDIERVTGKGRLKWIKTSFERRIAYVKRLVEFPAMPGHVCFSLYRNTREYVSMTCQTIALAIKQSTGTDYKVTVLIDGLPRSQERAVGGRLRQLGVHVRKVRGVKRDENDPLIRLADAICGLVRGVSEGQAEMRKLLIAGEEAGTFTDLQAFKNPRG